MKKLTFFVVALFLLLAGCGQQTAGEPTAEEALDWVDDVARAWVVAHSHNWDSDAEDDGIRIWVELQDKNEDEIRYENIEMPILIEVYTTESKTLPREPERLVYSGSSVTRSWDKDAFVTEANGIRDIAWEDVSTLPTDQTYGIIYVTITLPNGKEFKALYDEARIK